jgi:hypothetical protein
MNWDQGVFRPPINTNNSLPNGMTLHIVILHQHLLFQFAYHTWHSDSTSYPMGTGCSFLGGQAAGAWSWPLTSRWCQGEEIVDLYIHCPIYLHGVVLNPLRTGGWEKILQPGRQGVLNASRITTTCRHPSSEQFSQCWRRVDICHERVHYLSTGAIPYLVCDILTQVRYSIGPQLKATQGSGYTSGPAHSA